MSLLVAGADGKVWYGDYGGPPARLPLFGSSFVIPSPGNNVVGRVQPTTVVSGSPTIDLFPLATPLVGGRPTDIAESTNGDIAISEYLDNTLSLLRRTAVVGVLVHASYTLLMVVNTGRTRATRRAPPESFRC